MIKILNFYCKEAIMFKASTHLH